MMKKLCALPRWKCVALLGGVLFCLATGLILFPRSNPPPFVVLSRPFSTPLLMRDRLLGWVPAKASWAWVSRLADAVLGRRKPVSISMDVIELPDSKRVALSSLHQGATTWSNASGLWLCFLRAEELEALRQRLKQETGVTFLGRLRIATADGIGATLFVGQTVPLNSCTNRVGLSLDCYARVHTRSTDLFAALTSSEVVRSWPVASAGAALMPVLSIRTNLDLAARLQVPKGRGTLLLHARPNHDSESAFALLIDPL